VSYVVGRRLVVLGSAPAFEEVADEEGVEDAISLVVPGPLLSEVLGQSGAGTGAGKRWGKSSLHFSAGVSLWASLG